MTDRMLIEAHWGYKPFVLKSGDVAEKNKLACIDLAAANGQVCKGRTATTLFPIGLFNEAMTGDGVKTISIKMFCEHQLQWYVNDTTAPLDIGDLLKHVYIKDDQTMSADDTGRSIGGVLLGVDAAKGVLVYSGLPTIPAAT